MEENNENHVESDPLTSTPAVKSIIEGEGPLVNEESVSSTTGCPCPCDHQFSMNIIDYQLGAVIGFGSSAIVYMAKYLPLSMDVAIKMIELDHFERNRIDELRKEIQVMAFCKHSNLLGNLTSFVHESKLWIVTPFLAGGSCLDIMKSGFRNGFDEAVIATILVQALQGLEYLHENGHIHRDVKCGNLLMSEDGLVQLADFGVSSSLMEDGERHGVRKTYVGTPCWMAPEVMEITRGYNFKADIWSFGITALELAYGHAPYAKFPPMKVIYLTLSGKPPTLDKKHATRKYSRVFKDMIDCCLQRDPAKRPTAKALLKHPFFKSMAKKPQYLAVQVFSHVPPVNLRDKSAQLRARGLPVPAQTQEDGTLADYFVGNEVANKSFLSNIVASAVDDNENEDSWDFSIDNSVEADDQGPAPVSVFDVISEEEEDYEASETNESDISSGKSDERIIADPLPEARPLEDAEISFHGLQKNRTSRFILAADDDIKEAMDRLDLSAAVVSNEKDNNEIVGSVGDINALSSYSSTPAASSTSSSDAQGLLSTTIHATRSSSPNENNEAAPTEVKKGRFSVLETVNTSDVDPVPENELLEPGTLAMNQIGSSPNSNPPVIANIEEEKRSRFEVSLNVPMTEVSDSEDPGTSEDSVRIGDGEKPNFDSNSQTFIFPSMYHNSAPTMSGITYAPYPVFHYPNQISHQYAQVQVPPTTVNHPFYNPYQAPPSHHHHHHRPSLTSMPFYPIHSPHPGPSMATTAPLSPVNPVQLDHLLHVNDYVRNQLVELKYRQELVQIHQLQHQKQQQQQQQQQQPQYQHNPQAQGMRPHSSFNPHNYNATEMHPHQLHHSHPVMPPATNNEPIIGYQLDNLNCYCCPPSSSSNHISSCMTNSVSPAPADSTTSSSGNNANFAFILKELENIKKENEMLKAYLHHQQQQQQP
jgi:serine/threonine protein kinase